MQKWLKLTHLAQKMAKTFFLKNRRTTCDIFQYWSVFSNILGKSGQYLVSILGKSGQYSGQYTDFFLQTTVVITAGDGLNTGGKMNAGGGFLTGCGMNAGGGFPTGGGMHTGGCLRGQ